MKIIRFLALGLFAFNIGCAISAHNTSAALGWGTAFTLQLALIIYGLQMEQMLRAIKEI